MNAYTISELPEDVRRKVLDKHRELCVYDEWYNYTYEDFTQEMKDMGFRVDNIHFSGFWSQGDGACFEGRMEDLKSFLKEYGCLTKYKKIYKLYNEGYLAITTYHRGHYYHEYCMYVEIDGDDSDNITSELWKDFEDFLCETLRSKAKELYRKLEKEYDYLTSDDTIKLDLEELEYYFDENGEPVDAPKKALWGPQYEAITL